jgi:hypothetical protein
LAVAEQSLVLRLGGADWHGCISVTGTPEGVAALLADVKEAALRCDEAAFIEVAENIQEAPDVRR